MTKHAEKKVEKMKTEQPKKISVASMDIPELKKEILKGVLPEVFAEDQIDIDQLKRLLGEWVEPSKERFGLTWPGKADCTKIIQQSSVATLKPARSESIDFDETNNLFIEGDNLEVLKILQKSYFGRISMIYIDPPYNTGNDFIYPDTFAETLETYLIYTGQIDNSGKKFSTNAETNGRYHSRWLSMMHPRLYLAKNLLADQGLIFISIDDTEAPNLRLLCNEIFGEENFVAQFVWKSRVSEDNRKKTGASTDHEYVICYRRSDVAALRGTEKDITKFTNTDNDPRGPWRSADMTGLLPKEERPNCHYELINPQTGINYGCPPKGWRFEKATMNKKITEGRIIWPQSEDGRPRQKLYQNEMDDIYKNISSIITETNTSNGTREVNEILGSGLFPFPKPTALIEMLIEQSSSDEECIILDLFAGSCTTAHAVINQQLKGKQCNFIVVQLPERIEEGTAAWTEGYRTIAEIGKERIRRVSKRAKVEHKNTLNLNISQKLDLGFKVFKLSESSFKIWQGSATEPIEKQLTMHVDHLSEKSTPEDILFELLLKAGFPLNTKVEKITVKNKEVYSIEGGAMLICLDKNLSLDLIDAIADKNPLQVICLDEGFKGNDQLKANAVQTFKARAAEEESEIVFRTI